MNAILIYPPDAERARFFRDAAQFTGSKVLEFTEEYLEEIEEMLFATHTVANDTGELVSSEEVKAFYKAKLD